MNDDIRDVDKPHTSWKLKNSSQNFDEAGSSITIDNERIAR